VKFIVPLDLVIGISNGLSEVTPLSSSDSLRFTYFALMCS